MKIKALKVAAGVSAPLILAGSVHAGFTGITTTSKPNAFGLLVVNVAGAIADASVFTGTFGVSTLQDAGWAVTPNSPQGNPFDAVNSFPGDGRILIGQFATADGTSIQGTMLLQFTSNGVAGVQAVVGFNSIPAPGALAMMGSAGLSGLFGTRRRRRQALRNSSRRQ